MKSENKIIKRVAVACETCNSPTTEKSGRLIICNSKLRAIDNDGSTHILQGHKISKSPLMFCLLLCRWPNLEAGAQGSISSLSILFLTHQPSISRLSDGLFPYVLPPFWKGLLPFVKLHLYCRLLIGYWRRAQKQRDWAWSQGSRKATMQVRPQTVQLAKSTTPRSIVLLHETFPLEPHWKILRSDCIVPQLTHNNCGKSSILIAYSSSTVIDFEVLSGSIGASGASSIVWECCISERVSLDCKPSLRSKKSAPRSRKILRKLVSSLAEEVSFLYETFN